MTTEIRETHTIERSNGADKKVGNAGIWVIAIWIAGLIVALVLVLGFVLTSSGGVVLKNEATGQSVTITPAATLEPTR